MRHFVTFLEKHVLFYHQQPPVWMIISNEERLTKDNIGSNKMRIVVSFSEVFH